MNYNMDFYDSFGLLLFVMLFLAVIVCFMFHMIYWIYDLIVKRRCHIYRTNNKEELERLFLELDNKKYEILNFLTSYNREGKEEYLVIYRRKKKKE